MYAELCNKIKDRIPNSRTNLTRVKKATLKRCLLKKCQKDFEQSDRYDEARDEETAHLDTAPKTRRVRLSHACNNADRQRIMRALRTRWGSARASCARRMRSVSREFALLLPV